MLSWEAVATLKVLEFDLSGHVSFGPCVSVKLQVGFTGQMASSQWASPCYGMLGCQSCHLLTGNLITLCSICEYREKKSTREPWNLKNKETPKLICWLEYKRSLLLTDLPVTICKAGEPKVMWRTILSDDCAKVVWRGAKQHGHISRERAGIAVVL